MGSLDRRGDEMDSAGSANEKGVLMDAGLDIYPLHMYVQIQDRRGALKAHLETCI